MTVRNMSTHDPSADALALLNQALELSDQTDLFPVASGISLIDAMPSLIQLASGNVNAVRMARGSRAFHHVDDSVLRAAAMRCLRQLYLGHVEDPYRLLGLNPWASPQEVRERYRKLIRLFHPDRGAFHEQTDSALAANLNLAYARVGNQGQRAAIPPRNPSAPPSNKPRSGLKARSDRLSNSQRSQGWLIRAEQWIDSLLSRVAPMTSAGIFRERRMAFGIVAVLLCLSVGLSIWLAVRRNAQDSQLVISNYRPPIKPSPPDFNLSGQKIVRAGAKKEVNPWTRDSSEKNHSLAAGDLPEDKQLRTESVKRVISSSTGTNVAASQRRIDEFHNPSVAERNGYPRSPSVEKNMSLARLAPDQRASANLPRPFAASHDEIERFIGRYIGSYVDGDLEQLLSLMDENMSYDTPGGKLAARQVYQRLFQASSWRDLILRDVVWSRYGDRVTASPRFEERVMVRATGEIQYQKGVMHIELLEENGKISIGALSHKTLRIGQ